MVLHFMHSSLGEDLSSVSLLDKTLVELGLSPRALLIASQQANISSAFQVRIQLRLPLRPHGLPILAQARPSEGNGSMSVPSLHSPRVSLHHSFVQTGRRSCRNRASDRWPRRGRSGSRWRRRNAARSWWPSRRTTVVAREWADWDIALSGAMTHSPLQPRE